MASSLSSSTAASSMPPRKQRSNVVPAGTKYIIYDHPSGLGPASIKTLGFGIDLFDGERHRGMGFDVDEAMESVSPREAFEGAVAMIVDARGGDVGVA